MPLTAHTDEVDHLIQSVAGVENEPNSHVGAGPIDQLTAPVIPIPPCKLERCGTVEEPRAHGLISLVAGRLAECLREPRQHRSDTLWIKRGISPKQTCFRIGHNPRGHSLDGSVSPSAMWS